MVSGTQLSWSTTILGRRLRYFEYRFFLYFSLIISALSLAYFFNVNLTWKKASGITFFWELRVMEF